MSEKRTNRRTAKRIPIGQQRSLFAADKRPGYVRRFVTDNPGRIQQFLDAGYDLVKAEGTDTIGRRDASDASSQGEYVTRHLNGGKVGYLMEIPEEYYAEDQSAKEKYIQSKENSILNDVAGQSAIYGKGVEIDNGRSNAPSGRPTVTTI